MRLHFLLSLLAFTQQCSNDANAFMMRRVACENFAMNPTSFEDEPVVVQGILSVPQCDQWLEPIMTGSENEIVRVHQDGQGTTKLPLDLAAPWVSAESSHENPLYLTSTTSSSSCGSGSSITDLLPLSDTLEELFVNPHTELDDRVDWLACLGRHLPLKNTLVAAGEGATSPTICSHPYTKMILGLQGSQLLRILPPHPQLQQLAKPINWDDSSRAVCLGYQLPSCFNLFAYRHQQVDEEQDYAVYPKYAEDPNQIRPNFIPPQEWYSSLLLLSDLAVIPPGWWYQTYNLESYNMNVCLHSQRCGGSEMGIQLLKHLLDSSFGQSRSLKLMINQGRGYCFTKEEAQELVDNVWDILRDRYKRKEDDGDNFPKENRQEER